MSSCDGALSKSQFVHHIANKINYLLLIPFYKHSIPNENQTIWLQ